MAKHIICCTLGAPCGIRIFLGDVGISTSTATNCTVGAPCGIRNFLGDIGQNHGHSISPSSGLLRSTRPQRLVVNPHSTTY